MGYITEENKSEPHSTAARTADAAINRSTVEATTRCQAAGTLQEGAGKALHSPDIYLGLYTQSLCIPHSPVTLVLHTPVTAAKRADRKNAEQRRGMAANMLVEGENRLNSPHVVRVHTRGQCVVSLPEA